MNFKRVQELEGSGKGGIIMIKVMDYLLFRKFIMPANGIESFLNLPANKIPIVLSLSSLYISIFFTIIFFSLVLYIQ